MFSIKKKIAITANLMTVCLGQLYASDIPDAMGIDRPNQAVASINPLLHEDFLPLILVEASKDTDHPVKFRLVSSRWTTLMDKVNNPNEKNTIKLHGDFLQLCMSIWSADRFLNGVLRYENSRGGEKLLKFADLEHVCKGTFDLSTWGDTANSLVITTDPERFFEIGGKNQNKVVTLIALHQEIKQEINSSAKPLASIMPQWDAAKAPVCIVWRWGNDKNLTWFDYLTTASLSKISCSSLYENWMMGVDGAWRKPGGVYVGEAWGLSSFSCQFFVNQNKNY